MFNINLFSILFIIYFMQVIIHIVLCYKIMKSEKIISSLMDFVMNANSGYLLLFQVFLGRTKNRSFIAKLFRINLLIAINIFILMILIIVL